MPARDVYHGCFREALVKDADAAVEALDLANQDYHVFRFTGEYSKFVGNFNATLRDYGRLGILLANDGALDGKQIIPRDYLLEATDWHRQPDAFRPQQATPYFGYGYQFWPFPGEKRRFALLGVFGQAIFVYPELKLVMVTTAATKTANLVGESYPRERGALWRAIVEKFGSR